MKIVSFLFLSLFLFASKTLTAQTTTLVPPGENTIATAVEAAGENDTLVLARGEDYTVTQAVPINKPVHLRSSPGTIDEKPAVIFFTSSTDEGGALFEVGANCSFTDLGMVGKTAADKAVQPLSFTVPGVETVVDNCIIQDTHEFFSTGGNISLTIKNSIFFNFSWSLYDGWVGQMGGWDSDSVYFEFVNNTVFQMNRYFNYSTTKFGGTSNVDHNTVVNTFNNTLFPLPDKEIGITNNIFLNTFYRGYVGDRVFQITTDSTATTSDASSNELGNYSYIPESDTLNGDIAIVINPLDSTSGRIVNITNNMKFTEQRVLDFHAEVTATTQPLINETVKDVLAPNFGWVCADNLDGSDGFDPMFAIGALSEEVFEKGFQARKDRISPENESWYDLAWRPDGALVGEFIWPLPFDFTPGVSTHSYSSDGYPLGDLNWYGKDIVESFESGQPYDPTGIQNLRNAELGMDIHGDYIHYAIQETGPVTLKLYSITGAEVTTLVHEIQAPGNMSIQLPSYVDNGIYICNLKAGDRCQSKKLVVIK